MSADRFPDDVVELQQFFEEAQPGQKVQALAYENRIEFIPVKSLKSMRGFLRGIDTSVRRERDRV